MRLLIRWITSAIAVAVASYLLPGVTVSGPVAALVAAVALGFINAVIRPLLLVFTLPVNLLTLGLFTLVVNAACVMLASGLVPGFYVSGFWSAVLFSVVLWLVNLAFGQLKDR